MGLAAARHARGDNPGCHPANMLRTFRSRLLLGCTATFLAMLLLLQWNAQRQMTLALQQSLEDQAQLAAPLLAAAITPLLASRDYATLQDLLDASVGVHGLAAMEVLDHRGERVAVRGQVQISDNGDSSDNATLVLPLMLAGQTYGQARVRLNDTLLGASRQRLVRDGLFIGALVLLAGGMALALVLALLGQGSARLVQAARRIAGGDLSVQLPTDGAADVREVAVAFNRMSQAVQAQVQALRDSEQRLRSVVAALSEGLIVNDADGRMTEANEAAARMLGVPRDQIVGTNAFSPTVALLDTQGRALELDERPAVRSLRSGQPQRDVQLQVPQADGSVRWLQVNCEPIVLQGGGRPVAVVSTLTDITPHVQAEERLRQANQSLEQRVQERTMQLRQALDAAEQASRAKSEFLSRMSHELRTPLNAILGFSQLLGMPSSGLGEAQRAQLQQIETAGWHLLELIDEVLDLARIEAGAMTVSLEPVALGELCQRALHMCAPLAQRHGVTLHALPAETHGLWVLADRKRLLQVLNNLLSNAIKYNRRGGDVRLSAETTGDEVHLGVTDKGQGLTPAQVAQLFVPFQRLGADGDATPGTGIGLVITRRLTELMGGRLELDSSPGQGSRFTVVLRAAADRQPAARAGTVPPADARVGAVDGGPQPRLPVVYVEDNPSNVQLLLDVLAQRPALQVQAVTDGLAGLTLIREQPPVLAIIDIDLPGMDGRELCRRLRADPATAALPLLALTAQAMPRDLRLTREAGFDLVLTKPLDVSELLAAVDLLLRRAPGTAAAP
jgi:PAS domain S-box-containing protein